MQLIALENSTNGDSPYRIYCDDRRHVVMVDDDITGRHICNCKKQGAEAIEL